MRAGCCRQGGRALHFCALAGRPLRPNRAPLLLAFQMTVLQTFPRAKSRAIKKQSPQALPFRKVVFPRFILVALGPELRAPHGPPRSLSKAPDAFRRASVFRINPPGEPRPLAPRAPAAFHNAELAPRQLQRRESRSAQAKTPQPSALCPRAQRALFPNEAGRPAIPAVARL